MALAMRERDSFPSKPSDSNNAAQCPCIVADVRLDYRSDLFLRLGVAPTRRASWSDLQLLQAAYLRWGETCVKYLEGDYAFVVWDQQRQWLFGARSAVGLRPFVYHVSPHRFLCASEPAQLLEDPAVSRELDPVWISFWLVRGRGHWEGSPYRDIQTLPPGHLLTVDAQGAVIRPFSYLAESMSPRPRAIRQEEYTEQFRALLTDAVRERLHDQGQHLPLFDLSGGLDSSSLVSLAASLGTYEQRQDPLECFHAVSDGSLLYVEAVTQKYPCIRLHTFPFENHMHFDGAFDPAPSLALPCRP
ncbi:MAG TPA: asparagine synthase-related protein, partial [Ktedonobacteraceae bacterium]